MQFLLKLSLSKAQPLLEKLKAKFIGNILVKPG